MRELVRSIYARGRSFFGRSARLEDQFAVMARTNLELARQVQELSRRLAHHERGPLSASTHELKRQRGSGLILPASARQ